LKDYSVIFKGTRESSTCASKPQERIIISGLCFLIHEIAPSKAYIHSASPVDD